MNADLVSKEWNLTFLKDPPSLSRPLDPAILRVAHCITGELRSLKLPSVYTSYKRWAIEPLKAPSTLFFVVNSLPESNLTGYKAAFDHLRPAKILLVTREDVVESNLRYENISDWHRFFQYAKFSLCFELVRRYERSSLKGALFSHIILTRPDVLLHPFGPASSWRRDTMMVPPTEFMQKTPPDPVEKDLTPAGRRFFLTEIINIVPRRLAHQLFSFLLEPHLPKEKPYAKYTFGDRVWSELVFMAGLNLSYHPIEYHLVRDMNDHTVRNRMLKDHKRLSPSDVVPRTMLIYRNK
eukprot:CAMPEP_0174886144 /NCGR_PEP_ID=MMETSP0167-20121228/1415_1 /TAXON_ID=38298 /ORGANISM="Rhodella maculata, Strain CCMP736" /LENGTH=294 /DNA_ID=CAMNT_0016122027 /DNA_START=151 /DNA_END=1035 /DNA_ORIENTATION=-